MSEPKKFLKLTRARLGARFHSHIAYINEETRQGIASTDAKHTHPISWADPVTDPETGEVLDPGGWQVGPAEDGHTHEGLEEVELIKEKSKELDSEVVSDVWALWKEAATLEAKSFKDGAEAEDFYFGDQWDNSLRQRLEAESRAVLTKNFTQKFVDDLIGIVREEKKDIRFTPLEGGDAKVSDLLNLVAKHITERCFYQRERAKVFEDMAITGRGTFNIWVDLSRNLEGEIIIERFPWRDVRYGPHDKEDLSDLEYAHKDKLFSLGKIKQLWSSKAEEIEADFQSYLDKSGEADTRVDSIDPYASAIRRAPVVWSGWKLVDIARKEYRVIECWRRKYVKAPVVVFSQDSFYHNAYGWSPKDLASVRTIPGINVIDRNIQKIRITKIAGNVLLSDENIAQLPVDDFFLAPAYCKKRDSRFQGKVELAKDAQREINKRASQAIDIGNKMAAYNWFYDPATFIDDHEEDRFKNESSTPGAQFKLNSVNNMPQKTEGVAFPTAIVELMEGNKADLKELLNTTAEPWGANTSGTALLAQQRVVLRGNQFMFDNLEYAEKRVGRLLIPVIQRYWTPERIDRLVNSMNEKDPNNPVMIGGEPYTDFSQEDIQALLTTADLSEYDVEVTQGNYTPTTRIATNMMMTELAKGGYDVPFPTLIRFTDLPETEKEKMLADVEQQQAANAQAESGTRDMEVTKSLIGQGLIPPKIQQEYQVSAQPGMPTTQQPAPQGGIGEGGPVEQMPMEPVQEELPLPPVSTKKRIRVFRDVDGSLVGESEDVPNEEVYAQ